MKKRTSIIFILLLVTMMLSACNINAEIAWPVKAWIILYPDGHYSIGAQSNTTNELFFLKAGCYKECPVIPLPDLNNGDK